MPKVKTIQLDTSNKISGPDSIVSEVYKTYGEIPTKLINKLFNGCLDVESIHKLWKSSKTMYQSKENITKVYKLLPNLSPFYILHACDT